MKTIVLPLLLCFALISCDEDPISQNVEAGFDFQSNFDHDQVKFYIDNKIKLDKTLSTNYAVGVCLDGTLTENLAEGDHSLTFIINGGTPIVKTITITDDTYYGIQYREDSGEISFMVSDSPFLYL